MTTTEFSNEFDVRWDNIRFNYADAPSLNDYEKSLFLTTAQEQWIIKNHKGFETSEIVRRALAPIVKAFRVTQNEVASPTNEMNSFTTHNSTLVTVPADMWLVMTERAKFGGNYTEIVPITHDEFNVAKNDPFRKPSIEMAWRIDFSNQGVTTIEIISDEASGDFTDYFNRYVVRPTPIILDGVAQLGDANLSIRGSLEPITSVLSDIVHETILDEAIILASKSLNSNN